MPNGPSLLLDKSSLQSLSKAEAYWMEHLYHGVLTPTLLIEVIADLKKAAKAGRTPEAEVTHLAQKIGSLGMTPNIDYANLVTGDLLGYTVEMRGVPALGGGHIVTAKDGRKIMAYDEPPEMEAVRRWKAGDFQEYLLAEQWRRAVSLIDLGVIYRTMKWTKGRRPAVKTLGDVLTWVDVFIDKPDAQAHVLKVALQLLPVPVQFHRQIEARWKRAARPMLRDFAGYARHVLRVDLFFFLSIAADLIGRERPSNRIDVSYLYYLPFCKVFTSRGLHRRMAPLLVAESQSFVDGDELKKDMARLNAYYEALPPEIKIKGSRHYADYPPSEGDFLTSRLWDQFHPGWRGHAANPIEITPERSAAIMKQLAPILDAIEEDERRRGRRE